MANQPMYPYPYMDTIDVTNADGNIFKCLTNSKDTVVSATIKIYRNADNSLVKTVELPSTLFPFVGGLSDSSWLECYIDSTGLNNGIDYKWTIGLVFDEYQLASCGTLVGYDENYLYIPYDKTLYSNIKSNINSGTKSYYITVNSQSKVITSVSNVDYEIEDDEYIEAIRIYHNGTFTNLEEAAWYDIHNKYTSLISPEYFFKARKTPTLVIDDIPEKILSSTHTFTATYTQEQKVGVAYFEFNLYNGADLVASSGQIFSQNISHTFENLVNGNEYCVELIVVNNDGLRNIKEKSFLVEYELMNTVISPVINVDNLNTCIKVDFSNNASIPSTLVGANEINYDIYGTPDSEVVSSGDIINYEFPTITIQAYDNLMPNMYIRANGELSRIINFTRNEDRSISAILETEFVVAPIVGSYYEVCSYYNGICLKKEEAILWDKVNETVLSLPDRSSQVIHWHGGKGYNGLIVEKINSSAPLGSTEVYFDGEKFICKMGTTHTVEYSPHIGVASAIAGRDSHSHKGIVGSQWMYAEVSPSGEGSMGKYIDLSQESELLSEGNFIQIENEYRKVLGIKTDSPHIAIIDHLFDDFYPHAIYVLYDENYLYKLDDSDELLDTDILIDNDLINRYWWLIVLLPDDAKFIKTVPFTESEV